MVQTPLFATRVEKWRGGVGARARPIAVIADIATIAAIARDRELQSLTRDYTMIRNQRLTNRGK